jgi:hypothetical protein
LASKKAANERLKRYDEQRAARLATRKENIADMHETGGKGEVRITSGDQKQQGMEQQGVRKQRTGRRGVGQRAMEQQVADEDGDWVLV